MLVVYIHSDNFGGMALEGGLSFSLGLGSFGASAASYIDWKTGGNTRLGFSDGYFLNLVCSC